MANVNHTSHGRHTVDETIRDKQAEKKENMQLYVSFALMIVLTAMAFVAVASEQIPAGFAVPFILLLACIQFILQLFIFMHLNEKGSEYPILFMFSGVFVAILTIAALMLLIWW
ncbi:cytochrome C oxidase subunit IV [Caldalkalibacillus thermarum TA2.A1]|uniref:Cytochrome C oxidase subunit IV n=1 Tax=Caldalkalibacillus thermarum (strain TA2.A1) TaxID=986075 RepID=F5L9Q2_CALTT|nr:cytochrome C oxidase subunit IV family protein [Caldalkalibacillus thermarum]EGL81901.1 cytochrome C oxidase subunit IV [Caldalkalibacillus thermarum TA2.A1]QZT32946.1 cytochrome C oxidase subunit IV family protein [Caldalkalibacillus thermarum TA2.A1]GGK13094.1 cytochrome c oxidase subunit 4B [Caldalkalibacillus thermarum]